MTDNQDLLAMTHLGEDPSKYMKSVTPPIFMNSLHVFDSVEDYFSVDIFKDEYYYGRASNPTVTILEKKLAALEHGTRAVVFSAGMAACAASDVYKRQYCYAHYDKIYRGTQRSDRRSSDLQGR